jgi:NAD(P)-dependent dehydrogenase (short-subunit alcohol dehydrogenase family)
MKHTVLITGCSTGIGRALAMEFHKRGHAVYASARRVEAIEDLARQGIHVVPLDVTDAASIGALQSRLSAQGVRPSILINNAGYGAMGPLAEFPLDELRRQFETNVFAVVALVQALLPQMIAAGDARIVNISSISGVTTTPFSGAYCASKAALTAMSDALRMELAPFGVRVVNVEPGGIRSEFGNTASKLAGAMLRPGSLYEPMRAAILARANASQAKSMPAETFAQRLADAVLAPDPAPTVRLGPNSRLLPFLKRWMPTRSLDRLLCRKFGVEAPLKPAAAVRSPNMGK